MVQYVVFVSILTLGMAASLAQEKYQIKGNSTYAIIDHQGAFLDDVMGTLLSMSKMEGVNYSTGAKEFMDEARLLSVMRHDNMDGTSQGYSKFTKNDDVVYFKSETRLNNTLSDEGNPVTTFEGNFTAIKGTGQYDNIRGSGTFKGRYLSGYILYVDWEGEYWIDK